LSSWTEAPHLPPCDLQFPLRSPLVHIPFVLERSTRAVQSVKTCLDVTNRATTKTKGPKCRANTAFIRTLGHPVPWLRRVGIVAQTWRTSRVSCGAGIKTRGNNADQENSQRRIDYMGNVSDTGQVSSWPLKMTAGTMSWRGANSIIGAGQRARKRKGGLGAQHSCAVSSSRHSERGRR